MAQSKQMIETLDDCFMKTADNIMKNYGKILARLEMHFRNTCFFFQVSTFLHIFSFIPAFFNAEV